MRTGPFSSTAVIDRLNASFVPVYAVNEDYRGDGPAPKAEKAEYLRIFREAGDKKFSVGTVHVYVLNPKGEVIGTRHVADAAKTKELIAFLDEMTAKLGTKPGKPLVEPRPQSTPPEEALSLRRRCRRPSSRRPRPRTRRPPGRGRPGGGPVNPPRAAAVPTAASAEPGASRLWCRASRSPRQGRRRGSWSWRRRRRDGCRSLPRRGSGRRRGPCRPRTSWPGPRGRSGGTPPARPLGRHPRVGSPR